MNNDPGNKNFVNISNKDIYEKLIDLEKKVITMNGTTKANRDSIVRLWWAFGTSFSFFTTVMVVLLKF